MINCVAIDDEPIALGIIEKFCARKGGIDLKAFTDAREGLEFILANKPEIAFLDIELNDFDGRKIARELPAETMVIFTTAYLQYAVDGFNLDAVDFLHKPFSYERFVEALERAERRKSYSPKNPADQKFIVVKQDYSNVPLSVANIRYIEAMENYSKIFLADGKTVVAHNSLKNIEDMLPNGQFVRIHRSFIIPVFDVKSFTRQNVNLNDGTVLPVGRQFANVLFDIHSRKS